MSGCLQVWRLFNLLLMIVMCYITLYISFTGNFPLLLRIMWCECFFWISLYPRQQWHCGLKKTIRGKSLHFCGLFTALLIVMDNISGCTLTLHSCILRKFWNMILRLGKFTWTPLHVRKTTRKVGHNFGTRVADFNLYCCHIPEKMADKRQHVVNNKTPFINSHTEYQFFCSHVMCNMICRLLLSMYWNIS